MSAHHPSARSAQHPSPRQRGQLPAPAKRTRAARGARNCAGAAAAIAILVALASPAQAASPERIRDLIQQGLQTPAPAPHIVYDCILDDVIEGELIRPEVLSPPPAARDWLEPPSDFEEALHDDATDLH